MVEVVIAGALFAGLLVTGMWAAVTHLRIGSHEAASLVGMGKIQVLFAELERDLRDARSRGDAPILLPEKVLRAIGFPGSTVDFAELPKPIGQLVSIEPQGADVPHSGQYIKRWKLMPNGWEHNPWPPRFNSADDDLEPHGFPELEPVAAGWTRAYEETVSLIVYPASGPVERVFVAIFRAEGWAIYTHYVVGTQDRPKGSVWRWTVERGAEAIVSGGVEVLSVIASLEFAAHPGQPSVGMELVKSAVQLTVDMTEPDAGNAIDERRLLLGRRVYPPWLQSPPHRLRWVARP